MSIGFILALIALVIVVVMTAINTIPLGMGILIGLIVVAVMTLGYNLPSKHPPA